MRDLGVATLDDLAARIEGGRCDGASTPTTRKFQQRVELIRNAKIATESLFLSLEPAARQTGIMGYQDLINKILPGTDDWRVKLKKTKCRVLTFNYDRLFEMAFLNLYGVNTGTDPLYGLTVLNSGMAALEHSLTDFAPDRFCFLKLHGSIGSWWAQYWYGTPEFLHDCHGPAPGQTSTVSDEFFSPFFTPPRGTIIPESLIVFPTEKMDSLSESSIRSFLYRQYIQKIWAQAKALIAEAGEIWVVGYSFAALDITEFTKLLRCATNCDRIVVQNLDAERICSNLAVEYPELASKLKPHLSPF
jgi:hypothetical protein